MWVKICANTNLDDTLLAIEAGADAVGFVFAASKRRVSADQVAAITPHLPEAVRKVGVFTSTDAGEIVSAAATSGLDTIQLHSPFDPGVVEAIARASGGALRILQVLDVREDAELGRLRGALRGALRHPQIFAVLLDASHGGASGGTGTPFDWQRVSAMVREVQLETGGRVIVAGGLRPDNVGEAIARFQPWGVDVASGVEATPGRKDAEKVRAFVAAARAEQR